MHDSKDLVKRIQIEAFGTPEVLKIAETPLLNLADTDNNKLLIKVIAAGVNPIDAKIRQGTSFVSKNLNLPAGLGFDVCGKVIKTSKDINQFSIGDMVFGAIDRNLKPCAYSEYCIVNASDMLLKPKKLSAIEAAAIPIAGLTAWQALFHKDINLTSKKRVLIHAGAGGVGHIAIQLAKIVGAYVITTASEKHHTFLRSLGADEVIDYKKQAFDKVVSGIDLVIDLVGGDTGIQSVNVLNQNGIIVTVPTVTHAIIIDAAQKRHKKVIALLVENSQEDLSALAKLIIEGKLVIKIAAEFPLASAKEAHYLLEKKQTQGKIVLTV
ncbi:NADP-dependent oxidoreductase [Thiotrichales bacterium 19S3-7]|nr:NADP-dependent oxidoreductase [Thiotrichales bacterium 19S3-7]MCF6802966.1 NADP-dependent oxidoreductase [Thiotrichales bacterium 19S3-11]